LAERENENIDGSIFLLPSRVTVDAIMQVVAEGTSFRKSNRDMVTMSSVFYPTQKKWPGWEATESSLSVIQRIRFRRNYR